VGGGVAAVAAAVTAGLGISALARRMVAFGVVEVGLQLGLPALPRPAASLLARNGKPFKSSVERTGPPRLRAPHGAPFGAPRVFLPITNGLPVSILQSSQKERPGDATEGMAGGLDFRSPKLKTIQATIEHYARCMLARYR
jgi:hypothetical protein